MFDQENVSPEGKVNEYISRIIRYFKTNKIVITICLIMFILISILFYFLVKGQYSMNIVSKAKDFKTCKYPQTKAAIQTGLSTQLKEKGSVNTEPPHNNQATNNQATNLSTKSAVTVYSVKTQKKLIALTFDDGPDNRYTDKILEILKQFNIKATFFVIGKNIEKYPECIKRIESDGHLIGNHTYSHANLDHLNAEQIKAEIAKTQTLLDSITGHHLSIMRPPFGSNSSKTIKIIHDLGYSVIDWSVDTKDWAGTPPDKIMNNVLNETRPGGIILHHSASGRYNLDNEIQELPKEITTLKSLGYEFVTVPELMNNGD